MTEPRDTDDWIDALLTDVASADVPEVQGDLMARVLGDAEAALPAPGGAAQKTGVLSEVLRGLGGWLSVGGLVAATAVGFAIGLGAFSGTGLESLWLGEFGTYYEDSFGVGVHGWDFGEGGDV